jgi:hypothetical protein
LKKQIEIKNQELKSERNEKEKAQKSLKDSMREKQNVD